MKCYAIRACRLGMNNDSYCFPRFFSASAVLLHRIGERDRIFKCGAMIACAGPPSVRPPSGFGQRAKSVTILNSNYSSRNLQRAIKMEGKKGKGREGGREGEPRQAGNACGRSRSAGQGREMENLFQWKYCCCVEALWQQFGIRLLIVDHLFGIRAIECPGTSLLHNIRIR